jgi:hypothetical protein
MRVNFADQQLLKDDAYVVDLVLLGIVVGHSPQRSAVLTALGRASLETAWRSSVRSLAPTMTIDPTGIRTYRGEIRPSMSESEPADSAVLSDDLSGLANDEKWRHLHDSAFVAWLARVAENTFHPWKSRALAARHRTENTSPEPATDPSTQLPIGGN